MKKLIPLSIIFIFLSCKTFLIETALKKVGAFNEKVNFSTYVKNDKTLIVFPNIHLAVPEQYDNLQYRLDSLAQKDYFLYYEGICGEKSDTINVIKLNKLLGLNITKDYKSALDKLIKNQKSIVNKLIMQPKFAVIGATEANSKNLDMCLKDIIEAYESKYGQIEITDCDYLNYSNPDLKCKGNKISQNQADEILVQQRNHYLISNIIKDNKDKVIIVYGKGHYPGMHKLLIENNYQIIDSLKQ